MMMKRPARPLGADDLFVHVVAPDGPVRMRVGVVHGFAEHGGRYHVLARALADVGAEVHLVDGYGHGRSPGLRGFVPSGGAAVDAVVSLLERLQDDDVPVAIVGHSFGAALSLRAAQRRPDLLDAVVASAPFLRRGGTEPEWFVRLLLVAARLLPHVRSIPIDTADVSTLDAERLAYDEDPLVDRGGVRLGSARAMLSVGPKVLENAARLLTPTLLLHGSEDRLARPEGTRALYEKAAAHDVELREIPGSGHALLHDVHADRVREGIVAWLRERLLVNDAG